MIININTRAFGSSAIHIPTITTLTVIILQAKILIWYTGGTFSSIEIG
jgi:hypothetical protein